MAVHESVRTHQSTPEGPDRNLRSRAYQVMTRVTCVEVRRRFRQTGSASDDVEIRLLPLTPDSRAAVRPGCLA